MLFVSSPTHTMFPAHQLDLTQPHLWPHSQRLSPSSLYSSLSGLPADTLPSTWNVPMTYPPASPLRGGTSTIAGSCIWFFFVDLPTLGIMLQVWLFACLLFLSPLWWGGVGSALLPPYFQLSAHSRCSINTMSVEWLERMNGSSVRHHKMRTGSQEPWTTHLLLKTYNFLPGQ